MTERPQDVVAAGYDSIAARYAAWQSQTTGDPRETYVEKLRSLVPARPDVLEIGAGGGDEPTPTLARIGRLVGIDISRAQVERARAAVPNCRFVHGDVTTAQFQSDSFDAVASLYTLTHIPSADLPDFSAASRSGCDPAASSSRHSGAETPATASSTIGWLRACSSPDTTRRRTSDLSATRG